MYAPILRDSKLIYMYNVCSTQAAYTTAARDCYENLGEDATLLYIETQEELGNVTKFIRDSDDTGSTYWVGGKYDTAKKTFVWENGAEIGPWAPWDQGHPDTQTQLTRVYARTVGDIKLRTQFNTVSSRYICELKTGEVEEEAQPCYEDNDLVIVADSSGSIGQTNYLVAMEFTTRLAIAWADNPSNRLSVLIFASDVQSIFSLNQNLTVSEIRDLIYNAPYLNGGTASFLALDRVVTEFQQNPRQVPLKLVFLTDGGSTDKAATKAAAQRVKAAGVQAYSVGIGSGIVADELLAIAGGDQTHVFNTDGFDDLLKLLRPVSQEVCDNN